MERRLHKKIDSYIRTFKTDLCEQIQGNPLFDEHKEERDECQFCGTHSKGTPHGVITDSDPVNTTTKVEVSAIDIKGIVYYLDENNNVYDTEDVIANKNNPRIIAKYEKHGDTYSIPEFNL